VAHEYVGGWEHFVGGGVAVFDCNGDARPEILAAGGEAPMRLYVNATEGPGAPLRFDEGAFARIEGATGAYALDIDGDELLDLVILRVGPNLLLRGDGACGFSDVTDELGFAAGQAWSTSFSATWEAGRHRPTLAIGNYVDRDDPDGPFGACAANELHRAEGEVYADPRLLEPGFCALSMLISDWQRTWHAGAAHFQRPALLPARRAGADVASVAPGRAGGGGWLAHAVDMGNGDRQRRY
jgi:hypothetical protein